MQIRSAACAVAAAVMAAGSGDVLAQASSEWNSGYNSRTRLLAGMVEQAGKRKLFAGVEMALAPGWKTYWRSPGDSGGVPPQFDWSKSENVASATVRYPAPERLRDQAGDAVGYKSGVVLPIEIVPLDASKPVRLGLELEYGICREICVPAEAKLALSVDLAGVGPAQPEIVAALARVPRSTKERRASDPLLRSFTARIAGEKPEIVVEAEFPGGTAGADLFAEATEGIYLPLPKRTSSGDGKLQRFVIDLSSGIEPGELKGKTITLTMVSAMGQSEAVVAID